MKNNNNKNFQLVDDINLLKQMNHDQAKQLDIYQPGEYWMNMADRTLLEINKYGINEFRGTSNSIANSCSDNRRIDIRPEYNKFLGGKIAKQIIKLFKPLNILYKRQVALTKIYLDTCNDLVQKIIDLNPKINHLLETYKVPYSLLGDCYSKVKVKEEEYSVYYLDLLERHNNIAQHIDFNQINSVFEIGGGFGVNIHLLIENHPNIKKVLYLDIAPNLYIGTQYLKAFYGDAVIDYTHLKNKDQIKFTDNDELEILCIAPWQIENFTDHVDLFMNSCSFVEMSEKIVNNYAEKLSKFKEFNKTIISLTSFSNFDLQTTIHPNKLPQFFKGKEFKYFEEDSLLDANRKNLYYIST